MNRHRCLKTAIVTVHADDMGLQRHSMHTCCMTIVESRGECICDMFVFTFITSCDFNAGICTMATTIAMIHAAAGVECLLINS